MCTPSFPFTGHMEAHCRPQVVRMTGSLQLHDDLVILDLDGLDSMNELACFGQPGFDSFVHPLGHCLLITLSGEKPWKSFPVTFYVKILNLEAAIFDG